MQRYIRFETQLESSLSRRPLGIFRSCGHLDFYSQLSEHTRDQLNDSLGWFNRNLTVPRLKDSD